MFVDSTNIQNYNCFTTIKNSYKRIRHIYERKIKYFENFLIMAFTSQIIMFFRKPKKINRVCINSFIYALIGGCFF
jgi:hypothetical protein